MRRAASLLLLAAGCSGDKDTAADTGGASCGGVPPVVADLYCENTGLQTYAATGELTPTMTLWADVEDEDGDLTAYQAEVFFDDVIDGSVDTSRSFGIIEGFVDDVACGVPSIFLGTTIFLRGGQPLYETVYEWGITVEDAAGETSALASVTCKTPDKSGEGATQ